jgi:phytoene dehydrogenase-like protein
MEQRHYDAIVVGSGPNGLAAAITMQQQGLAVLLVEAKETTGGGMRTEQLTMPGYQHDVCSAVLPMAVISPFFSSLPLHEFGLEYLYPEVDAAHPFDDGTAAILTRSIIDTAASLGTDSSVYHRIMKQVVEDWPLIVQDILGPLRFPKHPFQMARFGLKALTPALTFAERYRTKEARGLWAGMAAHSIQPLSNTATTAFGLVLSIAGHVQGWPIPKGGAGSVAQALVTYFTSLGGTVQAGFPITSVSQLPPAKTVLFDVTPKQLMQIAGDQFSPIYKWQLNRYRYGMGVFKIDWALSQPIPFTAPECRKAGTVHIGNTLEEIAASEQITSEGGHPQKPFVLLAQPSILDDTRAPAGKHTAWAYCHVPNGSAVDMTNIIEEQVERFAPGFKDTIIDRHTFNTAELQQYNANYIGGDINGGIIDLGQLYTRPALRSSPYRTSAKGLYICSSSTPPGGGVHGMCGHHAAKRALKDVFSIG